MQRDLFKGRTAVVTGGGSGIGAACARLLSHRGARVVVSDRNEDAARAIAEEFDGDIAVLDVADPQAIKSCASRIERDFGPVDLLVTSAGIIQAQPVVPEAISVETWDAIFDIDLRGTFLTCVAFANAMRQR